MLKITIDTSGLAHSLQATQRKIERCTALALNKTAERAQSDVQGEQSRVFDRPVNFTQRPMRIKRATYSSPVATLTAGPRQTNYLEPEVLGGGRKVKAYERVLRGAGVLPAGYYSVPAKALKLDAFGNIPRGMLVQILRQIAAIGGYGNAKLADREKAVRGARRHGAFFVMQPGNEQRLPPGIYRWQGRDSYMVIAFVRPPIYRKRLDLHRVGSRSVADHFATEFGKVFAS